MKYLLKVTSNITCDSKLKLGSSTYFFLLFSFLVLTKCQVVTLTVGRSHDQVLQRAYYVNTTITRKHIYTLISYLPHIIFNFLESLLNLSSLVMASRKSENLIVSSVSGFRSAGWTMPHFHSLGGLANTHWSGPPSYAQ